MTANVQLSGFPPVHRIKFNQGSTEAPGRCIIDCGNEEDLGFTQLPRTTQLTIQADGFSGTWSNMRVVKQTRARFGKQRVVLEDSRWILEKTFLNENYNKRDCTGKVLTQQKKTISELVDIIEASAGITIAIGTVPSFEPPAEWAGKTCGQAMRELLDLTGCRLVFQPESDQYKLSQAGTGVLPDFSNEVYQPAPPNKFGKIVFKSHPTLHESRETVTAVYIDEATGAVTDITSGDTLPTSPTEQYGQTAYRLWHTGDSSKKFVQHRVKTHLPNPLTPVHESGRIIRDEWEPFPHHQSFNSPGNIVDSFNGTHGGLVFVTEHPVISSTGTNLSTEAEVLAGYYAEDGDDFVRLSEEREVNASYSDEHHEVVDWIKPFSSSEADVGASQWESLFETVSDALLGKYSSEGNSGTYTMPNLAQLNGSGQVGGVEYDLRISPTNQRHQMRVATNFTPGSQGAIR